MKREVVKNLEEIKDYRNFVFRRLKMMEKEASNLAGNNCIGLMNGRTVIAGYGRKNVLKDYVKAIMIKENPWNGLVNADFNCPV